MIGRQRRLGNSERSGLRIVAERFRNDGFCDFAPLRIQLADFPAFSEDGRRNSGFPVDLPFTMENCQIELLHNWVPFSAKKQQSFHKFYPSFSKLSHVIRKLEHQATKVQKVIIAKDGG